MHKFVQRRLIIVAILSLVLVPVHTTATGPIAGASETGRQLDFAPDGVELQITEYVGGFQSPVHVTNAGDGSGRLFVTELPGVVRIVEDGQILPEPFLDIKDIVRDEDGEQGLFSIEFHPNFASNGYFYVVYTKEPDGADVLARFQVSDTDSNRADPDSLLEILSIPDRFASHNGGDIAFGPDGYLYYSNGDEGDGSAGRVHAQDTQSIYGKMLRLDVDSAEPYAIPPDNPFVDDPDVLDEIWSIGLRNPWRFSFDRETGDFYIGDVGQATWEEVNFEPAGSLGGLNYGWDLMEGFACFPENVTDCDTGGLTLPILTYSHLGGQGVRDGCTVVGGEVYRGEEFPFMDGAYIFADWCEGRIWAGYRDDADEWQMTQIHDSFINWTSIGADEAGELYGTDLIGGRLFRFTFSQSGPPTLDEIYPSVVIPQGSDVEVLVVGERFSASSEVLWDGTPVATVFESPQSVYATIPSDLLEVSGEHVITVDNSDEEDVSNGLVFVVADGPFINEQFESVWNRTDELVSDGSVSRTWIWGPEPRLGPFGFEAYEESPDGRRLVLYFDKSRMEISYPDNDPTTPWYVTNGLLVVELMTGEMQVGEAAFEGVEPNLALPANINVAGDPNDPAGITYATLADFRDAPALAQGTLMTTVLEADGTTTTDGSLAQLAVRAGPLSPETGHRTASVFWDFMTSQGLVLEDGILGEAELFENPYFATGFPITEAYWTTVQIGGVPHQVLLQCFERRCLTFTPSNDPGWQVEAGNVGLHYLDWRYAR